MIPGKQRKQIIRDKTNETGKRNWNVNKLNKEKTKDNYSKMLEQKLA